MTQRAETRPVADDELLIERTFDAPAALVFRIWEKPEHMQRWWGPKDFTCTSLSLDFRPGGNLGATVQLDPETVGQFWVDIRDGNLAPGQVGGLPQ